MGDVIPTPVLLTLLPVVVGVGIASSADLEFTWLCFACAMGSNVFFSLRGVLSKARRAQACAFSAAARASPPRPHAAPPRTRPPATQVTMKAIRPAANLGPANLFGVLTIIAFLTALPIALLMEGSGAAAAWDKAVSSGASPAALSQTIAVSGLSFYLYNEVSFLALDAVDPVTHAVGNTIKVRAGHSRERARGQGALALAWRRGGERAGCHAWWARMGGQGAHGRAWTWCSSHRAPPPTARPLPAPIRLRLRLPSPRAARDPHLAERGGVRHQNDEAERRGLDDRHRRRLRLLHRARSRPAAQPRSAARPVQRPPVRARAREGLGGRVGGGLRGAVPRAGGRASTLAWPHAAHRPAGRLSCRSRTAARSARLAPAHTHPLRCGLAQPPQTASEAHACAIARAYGFAGRRAHLVVLSRALLCCHRYARTLLSSLIRPRRRFPPRRRRRRLGDSLCIVQYLA